jgi:hypothetical protein
MSRFPAVEQRSLRLLQLAECTENSPPEFLAVEPFEAPQLVLEQFPTAELRALALLELRTIAFLNAVPGDQPRELAPRNA